MGPQAHLILVLEARVSVESWRRKEEVEFCGKEGTCRADLARGSK